MIPAILIPILVLAAKLAYDYRQWLKHRNQVNTRSITNHSLEWVIMAAVCAYPVYWFTVHSSLPWPLAALDSAAMISLFIWLFFDGLYNKLRGFNWWFTGSGESTAANTDKFLKRLPVWLQAVVKVGGVVATAVIYIINYK